MRVAAPKIKKISPLAGIEGGKVTIEGTGFNPEEIGSTQVNFGESAGRILLISKTRIVAQIPEDIASTNITVTVRNKRSAPSDFILGKKIATEVNPVDNPIYDREGNLFVGFSGKRGEAAPVSVFKIASDGTVSSYLSNIPNPTSFALDRHGNLYISSRFEGAVYRATPQADVTVFARDLGTPTGLAFDKDGFLFVGDRSGRILKISPDGEVTVFAEIPESMVAFHLAFDRDGNLIISSPGLSTYNHVFLVDRYGKVIPLYGGFGRPQGIAVDHEGNIYLCEAKAADSVILKISPQGEITPIISGPIMVGLAFDGHGNVAVACQNAVYKVPLGIE